MDLNRQSVIKLATISSMKAEERWRMLMIVSGMSIKVIAMSGDRRARCRNSSVSSVS